MNPAWLATNAEVICETPFHVDPRASFSGKCRIGAYSYFGRRTLVASAKIGRFCSVAPNVTIGLGEHPIEYISTHPAFFNGAGMFPSLPKFGVPRSAAVLSAAPFIGHDVWLGANCIISRGVHIGNGAIIGAGAFVKDDVPDYAVAVGLPARVIRLRFPIHQVERLIKLKWWDFDISIMEGVPVDNIESTLDILEKRVADGFALAKYDETIFGRT